MTNSEREANLLCEMATPNAASYNDGEILQPKTSKGKLAYLVRFMGFVASPVASSQLRESSERFLSLA